MPAARIFILLFAILFFLSDCKNIYHQDTEVYQACPMTGTLLPHNAITWLLKPFAGHINSDPNNVIIPAGLEPGGKPREESPDNARVNTKLSVAKEKYHAKVDASLINFEEIRLNAIHAGSLTHGMIFKITLSDNIRAIQSVSGKWLQQLFDLVATKHTWSCSGISYQVKNKESFNIVMNGTVINSNSFLTLALFDHVANGSLG